MIIQNGFVFHNSGHPLPPLCACGKPPGTAQRARLIGRLRNYFGSAAHAGTRRGFNPKLSTLGGRRGFIAAFVHYQRC